MISSILFQWKCIGETCPGMLIMIFSAYTLVYFGSFTATGRSTVTPPMASTTFAKPSMSISA